MRGVRYYSLLEKINFPIHGAWEMPLIMKRRVMLSSKESSFNFSSHPKIDYIRILEDHHMTFHSSSLSLDVNLNSLFNYMRMHIKVVKENTL